VVSAGLQTAIENSPPKGTYSSPLSPLPSTRLFDNVEDITIIPLPEDGVIVVVALLLQALGNGHHLILIQGLEDLHIRQEVLIHVTLTDGRIHDDSLMKHGGWMVGFRMGCKGEKGKGGGEDGWPGAGERDAYLER